MPPDIHLSLALDPAAGGPAQVVEQATLAERGLFDAVFATPNPRSGLEPSTVLATVAASTRHIGVVAAVSPQYTAPFNQARYISTLDHISKGRAGWNLTLPEQDTAPDLHGSSNSPSDVDRYERAGEFTEVLTALWDSWDDDAVVADRSSGLYVRRASIHGIDHHGKHFAVAGPFNLPRSPQWHPPLFASVGSEASAQYAVRHADVAVLTAGAAPVTSIPSLRERVVSDGEVDSLAASLIEEVARDGVAGFVLHASIEVTRRIVDTVVPQLQSSGRFSTEYSESTLKERIGYGTRVGAIL
ncbi:LLM class flavin-dependent oxidoreductase [Rhodococcoides yunnanense]|uniref:LLM class flavin-dependent oxidoreductase n=1 Tax=Rhodococcoides yunnanense TaxID=278209 RepID=UPI0009351342|nr:LLM class flavin-dependent oxidoreductase [Rhodococcus yunnanensis]